jgi:hypothetical protein
MRWEKFQATVYAEEGMWLEDEFCRDVVHIYRKEMYPEIPKLWKATDGKILPVDFRAGVCSPTIIQRSTPASPIYSLRSMRGGKPTMINFPAKKSVPQRRVWLAGAVER